MHGKSLKLTDKISCIFASDKNEEDVSTAAVPEPEVKLFGFSKFNIATSDLEEEDGDNKGILTLKVLNF